MPIFDFACSECGNKFDVMISNSDKDKVRCPQCGSAKVEQKLSLFNTGGKSGGSPVMRDACHSCSRAYGGG
ncbi:MAG: FmdB family zinc ribbon protein [Syntrophomonadaceae bacterium]|jgi:putative FmdB family regulatory protein